MVRLQARCTIHIVEQVVGRRVGRCAKYVNITSFNGERDITTLKVFPISKVSDSGRRQVLVEAGQHYLDVLRKGHEQVFYDGYTLAKKRRHVSVI